MTSLRRTNPHPCPSKTTIVILANSFHDFQTYSVVVASFIKLIFTNLYRTVLTHVEKSLYCYLFFSLCTAYPLFLTRRYAGPFPEVLCWWMKLLVNFVPNCLLFSFCVNIILRVSIKAKFK